MESAQEHGRGVAIEKATVLFWTKGYHATSMRNLQQVLDLRPGSIYASFGSKEGLFKEVLRFYTKSTLTKLKCSLESSSSPLAALKVYIEDTVNHGPTSSEQGTLSKESLPNCMCLLVKTIAELTEDNQELLIESKRLLAMVEGSLVVLLSEAKAAGQLSSSTDLERLAHFLQMQITGLRIYAHTNDQVCVEQLIADLFKSLR
jgi:AcrR family transcriptional regulator